MVWRNPAPVGLLVCLLASLPVALGSRLTERRTEEEYLNMCMKGQHHKERPGPESNLYKQCLPWRSRSCCSEEVSDGVNHQSNFLNFAWNHCGELSTACHQHFVQDLCFYQCEPNVGPWLVQDVRKIRKERYENVPLCRSDCNQWWAACRDDLTCVENWAEHFNWSTGINTCPAGSQCKPFKEIYSGSDHFCEKVFGPSFQVVSDSPGDCFYLWFDPNDPNPNEVVAKKKIAQLLGQNGALNGKPSSLLLVAVSLCLTVLIR